MKTGCVIAAECYTRAMSRDKRLQDRSIYPHWCTDTVRFCDQDAAGHVNNVALCAYLETARLTFMRDMGMMGGNPDGTRGISAGMTVSFLAESHWPGQVDLGDRRDPPRHLVDHGRLGGLQGRGLYRGGRDDGPSGSRERPRIRSTRPSEPIWTSTGSRAFRRLDRPGPRAYLRSCE